MPDQHLDWHPWVHHNLQCVHADIETAPVKQSPLVHNHSKMSKICMLAAMLSCGAFSMAMPDVVHSSRGTLVDVSDPHDVPALAGMHANASTSWAGVAIADSEDSDLTHEDDDEDQGWDSDIDLAMEDAAAEPAAVSTRTGFLDMIMGLQLFQGAGGGRKLQDLSRNRCFQCATPPLACTSSLLLSECVSGIVLAFIRQTSGKSTAQLT